MENNIAIIRNLLFFLAVVVGLFIMKALGFILLPLVFALLMGILFLPLILFLEGKRFPTSFTVTVVALVTLGIIFVVTNVFISTIMEIIGQQQFLLDQLEKKFQIMLRSLQRLPFVNVDTLSLNVLLNPSWASSAASSFLKNVGSFSSSFLMFTLYFLFILPGISHYRAFLSYVGGGNQEIVEDYEQIQRNISTYMLIKSAISLVTGLLAWLACSLVGLQFAFFWGFLTFVLNFIPSVGSIIATLIPSLMALILLDSFNMVFLLIGFLGFNQFLIGNVIDPKIMGNRLRLNTVTVLFGLVFWGVIWGIPGMFLSVPLSVILKILLEKSESFSYIARFMGTPEKGNVEKRGKGG